MDAIEEVLTRGVSGILPSKDRLEEILRSGKKITLYEGFDPTAPSLHIGHWIGIRKLAQFQKLGHKIIFLIGDFTGMIGDPTDKVGVRKKLTRNEVLKNAQDYKKQVENTISFEGNNPAEIRFNSEWLDKLTLKDVIELSSHVTVQQMLERDFFQKRIQSNKSIFMHEFLYPLLQGYDSVALGVDLEIGGNDQLFNMMTGRTLMKTINNKDKFVMTLKLLADPNGKKMGKTEGNAINLTDTPEEIFGKIMSLPDGFIEPGIELLTNIPLPLPKNGDNLNTKKLLAINVIDQIHGHELAQKAKEKFEKTFQEKAPTFDIKVKAGTIAEIVIPFSPRQSMSSFKELLRQGAIDVNGKKAIDGSMKLSIGDEIKVGERTFLKVSK